MASRGNQVRERAQAIRDACIDERSRLNQAIADGKTVTLDTAFGPYFVLSVNSAWWYTCNSQQGRDDYWTNRSFCGCNDGAWHSMMQQAGLARNPMFAKVPLDREK